MKKINFKKIKAKNFLCFGKDGIEIDFSKYDNIVLIRGKNYDVSTDEKDVVSFSNGVGKSSIPQIIVYGLYGKTIRKPKKIGHKDVINHSSSKDLIVEVYWDDYKVERRRKPDTLRLWKSNEGVFDDSTEITLGGMPATQKEIENILGLNYETFVNIFVFTDDNSTSFLECDASEKRNIVENLLSLEKYRSYFENAKKINKDHLNQIKNLQFEIDVIQKSSIEIEENLKSLKNSKKEWKSKKVEEIKLMKDNLLICEKDASLIEEDSTYKKSQLKVKKINEEIEDLEKNINYLKEQFTELDEKFSFYKEDKNKEEQKKQYLILEKQEIVSNINKISSVLSKIEKLEPGVICDHCYGPIEKDNYDKVKKEHSDLGKKYAKDYKNLDSKILNIDASISKILENINELNKKKSLIQEKIINYNSKEKKLKIELADLNNIKPSDDQIKKAALLEKTKIIKESIQKALNDYEKNCPYDEMIDKTKEKIALDKEKINSKQKEYEDLKTLSEYYSFWVTAFGDSGIRKYIIDEIVPALNKNISYWLGILIDNKLEISFDNELEEKITKYPCDGNLFIYDILSNGQRRRINLALSQSFAHVMSLNTGRSPSIVFLDEVTTNIDPSGVDGIYKVICELSKEKQVFITTHDQYLLELLNGCQEINLKMKNGISKLN
jgi:DNA repair exonuclease SbcCD ATPase subunit